MCTTNGVPRGEEGQPQLRCNGIYTTSVNMLQAGLVHVQVLPGQI